jgi:hypothetical protein
LLVVAEVRLVGKGMRAAALTLQGRRRPAVGGVAMLKLMRAAVVVTSIAIPALGSADDTPDGGDHHWPGPEALAACKGKSDGDACTYEGHHGTVSGTCRKVPSGDLACMHPHHHHQGTEP